MRALCAAPGRSAAAPGAMPHKKNNEKPQTLRPLARAAQDFARGCADEERVFMVIIHARSACRMYSLPRTDRLSRAPLPLFHSDKRAGLAEQGHLRVVSRTLMRQNKPLILNCSSAGRSLRMLPLGGRGRGGLTRSKVCRLVQSSIDRRWAPSVQATRAVPPCAAFLGSWHCSAECLAPDYTAKHITGTTVPTGYVPQL